MITSHSHYKHVELEVLRVPARIVTGPGVTRVVPESDRIYTADEPGFYRLTVHDSDDQLMAMDIDIGPMATGSTLSSLAVQIGRRFPA